jgi:hypothetical protein
MKIPKHVEKIVHKNVIDISIFSNYLDLDVTSSKLLSWEVSKMDSRNIFLKINFVDPIAISIDIVPDMVKVVFKEFKYFIAEDGSVLKEN